jgi:hypothetical protein
VHLTFVFYRFFERGDPKDETYFHSHEILCGEAVYVVTSDMAAFVDKFLSLPLTARWVKHSLVASIRDDVVLRQATNCMCNEDLLYSM